MEDETINIIFIIVLLHFIFLIGTLVAYSMPAETTCIEHGYNEYTPQFGIWPYTRLHGVYCFNKEIIIDKSGGKHLIRTEKVWIDLYEGRNKQNTYYLPASNKALFDAYGSGLAHGAYK